MSERIQRLASYVRPGATLYDLCCDHGLIGLTAWDRGDIERLVFIDQSADALSGLGRELIKRGLDKNTRIELSVANAENLKIPNVPADFIIAGVGIRTIEKIIRNLFSAGLGSHRLILGPQQKSQGLRCLLKSLSFGLVHEDVVWEAGRFRELIIVESKGEPISLFGDRFEQSEDPTAKRFASYLQNYYAAIAARQLQSRSKFSDTGSHGPSGFALSLLESGASKTL